MGIFNSLNKIDSMIQGAKNKKEELKELTDKSRRTPDDIKCIKRANAWCTINLILLVPVAVGLYFLIKMIFSEMFLASFFGIIIMGLAMGKSVTGARKYTYDNAPSLGSHIYANIVFGGLILAVAGALLAVFII